MMKRIAIDMDEVMANPNARFLEWYERDYQKKVTEAMLFESGQKFYEFVQQPKLRNYLHVKGFFKDLPIMPDSQEVIKWLSQSYEIFVVTAAMEFRNSMEDKYDWLQDYFPFIPWRNVVFCGRKDMIIADYLIDDHVSNLTNFTGKGILYHAPHNLDNDSFTRVKNWKEVKAFFEKELDEKSD
ncbi:MAG: 5'(3')-deoxyribonucleotidase [Bacteroidota bacterium]